MGICIDLSISKSVTEEEWKLVYEESLKLVEVFPFAETEYIEYEGEKLICMIPTEERDMTGDFSGRNNVGWCATGDYNTLCRAEAYYFLKNFIKKEEIEKNAGDAIMGVLPECMETYWDDPRCQQGYVMWGNKTQGEPYHMYLLAVACMVEERLGEKAFIYGDITKGQCRKAVELANEHLTSSIQVPARCDMERFFHRVEKLPVDESGKLNIFLHYYLGTMDILLGEFIRTHFSSGAIINYWKNRFDEYKIEAIGFGSNLKEYLSLGFDLEMLCSIVDVHNRDGEARYDEFIKLIMQSKLHIKEKNCSDYLEIDQEQEYPSDIWTQFARVFYISARNKKVDRYISLQTIREILTNAFGDKCDVNAFIDEYLKNEEKVKEMNFSKAEEISREDLERACENDASEVFTQVMDQRIEKIIEEKETYDITECKELVYYENGDTIHPVLQKAIVDSYKFYHSTTKEIHYKTLMKMDTSERCKYLIENNKYIILRDTDWMHIFTEIKEKSETFERYYPMVRVDASHSDCNHMIVAFVLNDELYTYIQKLAEKDSIFE